MPPKGSAAIIGRMDCDRFRLAVSARLDGEDPGIEEAVLDRHLDACALCRHWEQDAAELLRLTRVTEADPIPDLSSAILAKIPPAPDPRRRQPDPMALRAGLGALGLIQLLLGTHGFLFGTDRGVPAHAARELGAFDLALAVAFILAAWRPTRAGGLLPFVIAVAFFLSAGTIVDLSRGAVAASSESAHLSTVVGLVLVWLVARATPAEAGRGRLRGSPA
jgi:predicted anti-sigma-YlaC factor YlaD